MTTLINTLKQWFKVPTLHKLIMQNEVRQANLIRSTLLAGGAFPISIVLLLFYYINIKSGGYNGFRWGKEAIYLDLIAGFIIFSLFCLSFFRYRKKDHLDALGRALPHVIFIVIGLWGTFSSIQEQSVTSSIIEFILVCFICSFSLLIDPLRLAIYLSVLFLIFYLGISFNQADQNTRLFNIANGFCTVAVCFGMAMIQWKNNMTRFKQSRLIIRQKEALESSYHGLLKSSEQLEEANASKDKFFSILAHDLRGPISSTLALTELLEEGFFETDENERKRMYRLLQSSLNTTAKLLENVLLWSRNQTGNINFNPVTVSLNESIETNISILKIVAAQKDIKIIYYPSNGMQVQVDLDMINTIFRNLISNAIKFTPNFGKVEIRSEEVYDTIREENFVVISITDNGIGMNRSTINNLFKIDNKTVCPGTNNEMGTGLGLILCHDFIQKHNGQIEVISKENQGSTFIIRLPFEQAQITNNEIPFPKTEKSGVVK